MPDGYLPSFLVRLQLAHDESLRGYISRLSDANCAANVYKPMLASLACASAQVHEIASQAGVCRYVLERRVSMTASEAQSPRRVTIGSICTFEGSVYLRRRRVCPQCLQGKRVSSCLWEICEYTVCHKHGCELVSDCWRCDQQLTWDRTSSAECNCGARLSESPSRSGAFSRKLIAHMIADAFEEAMLVRRNKTFDGDSNCRHLTRLHALLLDIELLKYVYIPMLVKCERLRWATSAEEATEKALLPLLLDPDHASCRRRAVLRTASKDATTFFDTITPGQTVQQLEETFLKSLFPIPVAGPVMGGRTHHDQRMFRRLYKATAQR